MRWREESVRMVERGKEKVEVEEDREEKEGMEVPMS